MPVTACVFMGWMGCDGVSKVSFNFFILCVPYPTLPSGSSDSASTQRGAKRRVVWMDGWVDGWMDGWMGGLMDGWMDGWVVIFYPF